ncbi:MAG: hypothetical protein ACXWZL_01505 [Mycobacterium sp.]
MVAQVCVDQGQDFAHPEAAALIDRPFTAAAPSGNLSLALSVTISAIEGKP